MTARVVMARLVPAIHVLLLWFDAKDVAAWHEAGHDGERRVAGATP
jgi:hypothetical protein